MRILGIFRGFPGLGRVVAGVSLLEELRDQYGANIRMISYLQGNEYLKSKGYADLHEATPMDYCSIGLVPTNKMGAYIHTTIKEYTPDLITKKRWTTLIHYILWQMLPSFMGFGKSESHCFTIINSSIHLTRFCAGRFLNSKISRPKIFIAF